MDNTTSIFTGLSILVQIFASARRTLHSTSLFKDNSGEGTAGNERWNGVYVVKVTGLANSALLENSLKSGDPVEFSIFHNETNMCAEVIYIGSEA